MTASQSSAQNSPPVVGVDVGGTNVQIGVVDGGGSIIARSRMKTEADRGPDHVTDRLAGEIRRVCEQAGLAMSDIAAVGICTAGAIDVTRGVVLNAPNLQWFDLPLRDTMTEHLSRPVVIDNDVNGAALAEYTLGAGAGRGDMLGVWAGTGIGGGLVLDGSLYHGDFFTAGEIGQTIIEPSAPPDKRRMEDQCGRVGLSRAILSLLPRYPDSIVASLLPADARGVDMPTITQAYAANDELVCMVVDGAADLLGTAIANVVTLLSLDTIVIGGGITEALGQPYVDRVRAGFDRDVFPEKCRETQMLKTKLEADAGLLGAAILARGAAV